MYVSNIMAQQGVELALYSSASVHLSHYMVLWFLLYSKVLLVNLSSSNSRVNLTIAVFLC